jgi:hypothetical protein
MYVYLTVVRYRKWSSWAGILSMPCFRPLLIFNKKIVFYKLLGCGKNGTFDKTPDMRQWCILVVSEAEIESFNASQPDHAELYGRLINAWWQFFGCEKWTLILHPCEGHGRWDGKEAFGTLPKNSTYNGPIAVLTRATIRLSGLKNFWRHVAGVASKMAMSKGFITSLGIGEVPWVKQATLSFWENKESMLSFSYKMEEHKEVIRKTREEKWYSEEMFVRFKIIASIGAINGRNPLQGKI